VVLWCGTNKVLLVWSIFLHANVVWSLDDVCMFGLVFLPCTFSTYFRFDSSTVLPPSYFPERNFLLIPHPGAMWKDDGLPAKCRGSSPRETNTFETIGSEAQGGCSSAQVTFLQVRVSGGTHAHTIQGCLCQCGHHHCRSW